MNCKRYIVSNKLPPRISLQWHLRHLFNVHAGKAKFLHDLSFDKVHTVATEWILRHRLREMNGVEEAPVYIDEGAEVHPFPFDGANIFDGDQQTKHANGLSDMGDHFVRQDVSPEFCFQQVEIAVAAMP